LGFIEVTAEQRQREVHFLQTVVDAMRKCCRVVPAYGTDELAPITTQLERAIAVEEFSVVLAATPHIPHIESVNKPEFPPQRKAASRLGEIG